jgi:AraC-like DNA-binding protein
MDRSLSGTPASKPAAAFDVVHARILRFFPELVGGLGGDLKSLPSQVGMDSIDLSGGGSTATYRQMVQLLEVAATTLSCPDFGMRLAMMQRGGMFGPLGAVMRNSRTFGDALDYASKHAYAHSLAAGIWLQRCAADKTALVGHDILLDRAPNKAQAVEQVLLLGHLAAMDITHGKVRVRRVHFRHQPVSSPRTYRSYFGCEVLFGQNEDAVVFSDWDLACPIVDPDAQAYQSAKSFIEAEFTHYRPPVRAQVRGVIMRLLGTEHCTNERIAAELHFHARTLHRRLSSDGTSFQQIKDEVRRDVLIYYLQETNLDFGRISEKLGFAEQSVMTRRCNRWFSASPTKLRSQGRRRPLSH